VDPQQRLCSGRKTDGVAAGSQSAGTDLWRLRNHAWLLHKVASSRFRGGCPQPRTHRADRAPLRHTDLSFAADDVEGRRLGLSTPAEVCATASRQSDSALAHAPPRTAVGGTGRKRTNVVERRAGSGGARRRGLSPARTASHRRGRTSCWIAVVGPTAANAREAPRARRRLPATRSHRPPDWRSV
jgi:hypothetical protein